MTESVEWERLADHEEGAPESADSWYDDAPITDEQIEAVRRDLDTPVAQRGAAFAPFVVRKLLAEIDRLNTVLDANRVVRNAAESSSRTLKGVVELLKTQRTQLRAELDKCAALNLNLVNENAEATTRADAAERELAEVRERMIGNGWRQEWGVQHPLLGTEYVQGSENARYLCRTRNEEHPGYEWRVVRRLTGEWKAADDA